jgi:hypothetical protein
MMVSSIYDVYSSIGAAANSPSIEIALAVTGGGYFDYMTTSDHLGLLLISISASLEKVQENLLPTPIG